MKDRIQLKALAKINLGLDVLRRREDGYHEVKMIMQTIGLHDDLEIRRTKTPGIQVKTNLYYLPTNENNLVYKAAKLLMDEFDIQDGVSIQLKKRIPVAAGMAGGSSDGAAVLWGNQPDVWPGAVPPGTDGPGCETGSGCSLLYSAGNCIGRRNRRKIKCPSVHAEMYDSHCKTWYQRVHQICL